MSQRSAIDSGNITRTSWPEPARQPLSLYQGSGRSGALWNAWGLMDRSEGAGTGESSGWMHADHWHRGRYGLDAWMPVGRLVWANAEPPAPMIYEQALTLWDGRLSTRMTIPAGDIGFCSYFDPGNPDILAFEIEYDFAEGVLPSLLLEPALTYVGAYTGTIDGTACVLEHDEGQGWGLLRVEVGTANSVMGLKVEDLDGASLLSSESGGLRLDFKERRGRHVLWLGAAGAVRKDELVIGLRQASAARWARIARRNWQKRWGSGWIRLPNSNLQALWARSHYYILCSYGADVRSPAAPMGWTGFGWPYSFPQDLSYIHPALLRLGHYDIAKAWVDFYHRTIPSMQEMTSRIYEAKGCMWAWEYPIGEQSSILREGAPNVYQYEIHNAAYPARMAYETALHLADPAWSREVAWEVVRETARFFASTLRRGSDGLWELCVVPSMGQDEIDVGEGRNYLCSLFSAKYSLSTAVRLSRRLEIDDEEIAGWEAILAEGLAFPRLLDASGLYGTREGVGAEGCLGSQKHPIQLNPLVFLPLDEVSEQELLAYARRHELCQGGETREYLGWTLPAYWLASSHLGESAKLIEDIECGVSSRNIDPDWTQIYESSKGRHPYYMTSHGLYMQALQDALVADFWGEAKLGNSCPEEWDEISFGGLRTADGQMWAGEFRNGEWRINPQNSRTTSHRPN